MYVGVNKFDAQSATSSANNSCCSFIKLEKYIFKIQKITSFSFDQCISIFNAHRPQYVQKEILILSGVVIGFQIKMFSPATYERGEKRGGNSYQRGGKKQGKHIKDVIEQRQLQCAVMGMTHWTDRRPLYHSLHGLEYLDLWIKILGFVD